MKLYFLVLLLYFISSSFALDGNEVIFTPEPENTLDDITDPVETFGNGESSLFNPESIQSPDVNNIQASDLIKPYIPDQDQTLNINQNEAANDDLIQSANDAKVPISNPEPIEPSELEQDMSSNQNKMSQSIQVDSSNQKQNQLSNPEPINNDNREDIQPSDPEAIQSVDAEEVKNSNPEPVNSIKEQPTILNLEEPMINELEDAENINDNEILNSANELEMTTVDELGLNNNNNIIGNNGDLGSDSNNTDDENTIETNVNNENITNDKTASDASENTNNDQTGASNHKSKDVELAPIPREWNHRNKSHSKPEYEPAVDCLLLQGAKKMKYLQCSSDPDGLGKTMCCGEKKSRYCCTPLEWSTSSKYSGSNKTGESGLQRPWDLTLAVYPKGMEEVTSNDGDETILVITKDDINNLPTWAVILIIIGVILLGGCIVCLALDCLCKLVCCSWAAIKNFLLCICCCCRNLNFISFNNRTNRKSWKFNLLEPQEQDSLIGGFDKASDEERLVLVNHDHYHIHHHKGKQGRHHENPEGLVSTTQYQGPQGNVVVATAPPLQGYHQQNLYQKLS